MDTFNDCLEKMRVALKNTGECVSLLITALSQNSTTPLKDCRSKASLAANLETDLTGKISRLAQNDGNLRNYLSVPRLVSDIHEQIGKLTDILHKKINEDILFSDRAMLELISLLQKLKELIQTTSDYLVTENPVLIQHITECEHFVVTKSMEFATSHEDRLIEGLCLPIASPLFLNMLNSIRCIACNGKSIALKISKGRES